jgi:hypothetical protein
MTLMSMVVKINTGALRFPSCSSELMIHIGSLLFSVPYSIMNLHPIHVI